MPAPQKDRTKRTVNIDTNVYNRILNISEMLGVNVNAYLLEAIGQKLFKDESLLRVEQISADASAEGNRLVAEFLESQKNPNK